MLTGLLEFITELNNFSFAEETAKILRIEDDDILNLLRGQLSRGYDGNEDVITLYGNPEYSPVTVEIKEKYGIGLGKETDRITLFMTGAFYESLYVYYDQDGTFDILSRDPKFPKIISRSGADILLLNNVNLEQIQEMATLFLEEQFNAKVNAY